MTILSNVGCVCIRNHFDIVVLLQPIISASCFCVRLFSFNIFLRFLIIFLFYSYKDCKLKFIKLCKVPYSLLYFYLQKIYKNKVNLFILRFTLNSYIKNLFVVDLFFNFFSKIVIAFFKTFAHFKSSKSSNRDFFSDLKCFFIDIFLNSLAWIFYKRLLE